MEFYYNRWLYIMLSIETLYTKSCDSFANIDLTNKIFSFPFPILSWRLLSTSSSPYLGKIPRGDMEGTSLWRWKNMDKNGELQQH